MPPQLKESIRKALLTWYSRHQRDLPWRATHDPYHILVSEIMLQQTQVERVRQYYQKISRKSFRRWRKPRAQASSR
jgi:A/G-specific adenine glycosylase